MNAYARILIALAIPAAISAGCGGSKGGGSTAPVPTPTLDPTLPQVAKDAFAQYPKFIDLQAGLLSTTCSPNPGVCHNSSNYPNFETAGNTLAYVGAPCNVEIPDPLQGWDSCERLSDTLKLGTFLSKLSFLTRIGPGTWHIGFKDPANYTGSFKMLVLDHDGNPIFEPPDQWAVMVATTAGVNEADVSVGGDDFIHDYVDSILKTVIGGDPNKNGVWGAEAAIPHGAVFAPGDTAASYMFGRITGTVPGSRMPLANAPITEPGYVAIACWIEGLKTGVHPTAEDPIDYNGCQFARSPIDYTMP